MHRIYIDWCDVSENYTTLIYCLRGALPLTSNCSKLYNIHGLRIGLCKFCACCITCICWYNWWNSDDASWNLKQNQHYLDLRHISGTATKFCKIVNLRRSTRFWRIRFWFVGSGNFCLEKFPTKYSKYVKKTMRMWSWYSYTYKTSGTHNIFLIGTASS